MTYYILDPETLKETKDWFRIWDMIFIFGTRNVPDVSCFTFIWNGQQDFCYSNVVLVRLPRPAGIQYNSTIMKVISLLDI